MTASFTFTVEASPANTQRALTVLESTSIFVAKHGDPYDARSNAIDFLTNTLHLLTLQGQDALALLSVARHHFIEEATS